MPLHPRSLSCKKIWRVFSCVRAGNASRQRYIAPCSRMKFSWRWRDKCSREWRDARVFCAISNVPSDPMPLYPRSRYRCVNFYLNPLDRCLAPLVFRSLLESSSFSCLSEISFGRISCARAIAPYSPSSLSIRFSRRDVRCGSSANGFSFRIPLAPNPFHVKSRFRIEIEDFKNNSFWL